MAESVEVEIIGNKSAQDLALNPENIPNNYIHKEGGVGFRDALLPSESDDIDIPVVDIGNLTSPTTAQQELDKLHSALSSWGLFQATNHGMTSLFLDKVREISKQFFDLPRREKLKYVREPNDIEGYGNDVIYSENQKLDWNDRLFLKVHPEDQRNFKFWPQKPNDFRNTIEQYIESLRQLYEVILRAIAKSLDLEEDCFLNECGEEASMSMRFSFYPPCPMPDHVLGVKPHADGSSITILLQDKEVEGLQVLKDNQWFKVPIIPDALVINVGDLLEIMSNGIFQICSNSDLSVYDLRRKKENLSYKLNLTGLGSVSSHFPSICIFLPSMAIFRVAVNMARRRFSTGAGGATPPPPPAENAMKLEAAETKLQDLKANMAILGKEAAAAMTAVEAQQQRLTLQRLIAMVEAERAYHQRVLQILDPSMATTPPPPPPPPPEVP
ncbi:codeine O-demethylase-like isoform X1 [Trifolium pratense]|uniref:codeine O-demethylase-like isoform X1 n=1 Tax=Trifolium pratense TaxID=57577 RepID=UPI001E696B41|nr:codeine O-demethylase-like isoform X1 [Trifolium pratense]XP_045805529.1 codeine O-demethylase-like isoform X1 [Trifolium pratense]